MKILQQISIYSLISAILAYQLMDDCQHCKLRSIPSGFGQTTLESTLPETKIRQGTSTYWNMTPGQMFKVIFYLGYKLSDNSILHMGHENKTGRSVSRIILESHFNFKGTLTCMPNKASWISPSYPFCFCWNLCQCQPPTSLSRVILSSNQWFLHRLSSIQTNCVIELHTVREGCG